VRCIVVACLLAMLSFPAFGGFADGLEAFERKDYAVALAEWRPLAEKGMIEAQYNLGLLYSNGYGVEADLTEALKWYLAAAEQGYARAQFRVGEIYEADQGGIQQDLIQAHFWLCLARNQKYPGAKKSKRRVAHLLTPEEIAQSEMLQRHRQRERGSDD
jgi:TPR repeat protein